ncbi:hypothetical protein [Paraburkholderia tropica]|uniref:hypothetical protein n=1 Tax=Paraburkholderia tropica TaxID=92647 RepID=UPI002AB7AF58|nr:hypothetical protein [Paraburkholderia tropica]
MQTTLAVAKEIYRKAIDTRASDAEGPVWWSHVVDEIHDVIAARTLADAAALIEWWHQDWTIVSETPRAAAKRIREAARELRLSA